MEEGNSVVSSSSSSSLEPADPISLDDDDNGDEFKLTCAICLDEFRINDKVSWSRYHKCNHVFHHECIIPWLKRHDECPYCRCNYIMPNNNTSTSSSSLTTGYKFGEENNDDKNVILDDDFIFCVSHGLITKNTECHCRKDEENPISITTTTNDTNNTTSFMCLEIAHA